MGKTFLTLLHVESLECFSHRSLLTSAQAVFLSPWRISHEDVLTSSAGYWSLFLVVQYRVVQLNLTPQIEVYAGL